jgi:UDP-N-acetylglucosamine 2-epimerase (non-hydrolysing)
MVYASGKRPKLAHVEAGLRSFDRTMPEEVNRVLTDAISDFLFTSEPSAAENLRAEGVAEEKVHFVGNVMIDSLLRFVEVAKRRRAWEPFGLEERGYGVVTLHRAGNVDDRDVLRRLVAALGDVAAELPLLFPVHPRTAARIRDLGLGGSIDATRLRLVPPIGYVDFLGLTSGARLVLTDSGGIQEESLILGIPCLTLRENTERPITLSQGTNVLVGRDPERIRAGVRRVLDGEMKPPVTPPFWDGKAAERIADVLARG